MAHNADSEPKNKAKHLPNLDGMTLQELTTLIDEAQAKRAEKVEVEKAALLTEFRERAAAIGVTIESLIPPSGRLGQPRSRPTETTGIVPAKYRGPNGEEWSGRGRKPRWLETLIAEGRESTEFLIDQAKR